MTLRRPLPPPRAARRSASPLPRSRPATVALELAPLLVDQLQRAYRGPARPGPALRSQLHRLRPSEALWRPERRLHCAWELLLHAAHAKFAARRLLATARLTAPRLRPVFPPLPAPANLAALRADLRLLDEQHRELIAAVRPLTTAQLLARRGRRRLVDTLLAVAALDTCCAASLRLMRDLRVPAAPRGDRR